jgi:hypothetical protein
MCNVENIYMLECAKICGNIHAICEEIYMKYMEYSTCIIKNNVHSIHKN